MMNWSIAIRIHITLLTISVLVALAGCDKPNNTSSIKVDQIKLQSKLAPITEGIADIGNVKLWYWDTGGSGEAIVLLHPASGSSEFYPHQQSAFAKAGYRVISYSRRGQFKSELGIDSETYYATDDLLNLMKYLQIEKFHVVGNALGGSIALDVALSHPERVRSLILACSLMGISEPEWNRKLNSLHPQDFNNFPTEEKELGHSYREANPTGVEEWKKLHERSGTGSRVRLRNKMTWSVIGNLKVPTLLITGEEDLFMPLEMLKQVGEKIPNSKVVIVNKSGHAVQWEQPEIFNQTVLDFIKR